MSQTHDENFSLPFVNKSHRCSKAKCRRFLSSNHPISYTNGLCERHFFSIDLSSSDDENTNNLINQSKLVSKRKQIYRTKNPFQPQRDDIRKTREIFDGHQWSIIEQSIEGIPSTSDNSQENFLEILRLLLEVKKQLN